MLPNKSSFNSFYVKSTSLRTVVIHVAYFGLEVDIPSFLRQGRIQRGEGLSLIHI